MNDQKLRQPIDRADHLRADPEALSALMGKRARLLVLDDLEPRLDESERLTWSSLADAPADAELIFLGLDGDRGCFAAVPRKPLKPSGNPLNTAAWKLKPDDFAIYTGARSLVDWHDRHRHCPRCGAGTVLAKGGWERDCANSDCGAQHFPRTDPVTIMLIENAKTGHVLLGRGKGWPERRFSALAGFVEPGETIEQGVAREVMEEAGLPVRDVRYISSQAWPFPSQLMIGCIALSDHEAITVDKTELDEVRWFTRGEVMAAKEGRTDAPFIMPPSFAIAHHLLIHWLDETADG